MSKVAPREFIFFLLRDNLRAFNLNSDITKNSYPFQVNLNSKSVSIFVNETHESGHGRNNSDECRIQINKEQWDVAQTYSSIFFGYNIASNVFSVWEPDLINSRVNPSTFSIYSRFSLLNKAASDGYSAYSFPSKVLGRDTFCLNFAPDKIGIVLNSFEKVWESDSSALHDVFQSGENYHVHQNEPSVQQSDQQQRQKVSVTSEQYMRDPRFKSDVLGAYDSKCAVCSVQLGIIEAAHIIPHSHENGSDDIQNGIALCPNHHTMFDSGLIGISETHRVLVNWARVDYLRQIKLSTGTDDLARIDNSEIRLPKDQGAIPSVKNIRIANKIRGLDWD